MNPNPAEQHQAFGVNLTLDQPITMLLVLGNSIATAVVAKWEGECLPDGAVVSGGENVESFPEVREHRDSVLTD